MVHRRQDSSESNHHLLPLVYPDHKQKPKPTTHLLRFLLLFSLLSLTFLSAPRILFPSYSFLGGEADLDDAQPPPCSSVANNTICCDRTARRSDVCYMRGDVRTIYHSSSSLFLVSPSASNATEEKIRPYTRKWEANTMSTIDELRLRAVNESSPCDVRHDVPAVFFSTGGYTGNVYHEFNDGILPLYITSQRFNRKVVFVILEYHDWWITKYENILSKLSDYAPIDFSNDKRTHCFPEAIVGLEIHDELTIDSEKMGNNNKTVGDFRRLLDESYRPRIEYIEQVEEKASSPRPQPLKQSTKPKLVIVSRNGSRGIENEGELVKLGDKIGFRVEVLRPDRTTELAKIYRALNSSDVMIGVHGAAMTHFLFMRPGTVFIQVVPLGTDWAAETYYGGPAVKLGLNYMSYKILPRESSLYREYKKDDPVLADPESVNARGWEVTKKVYLDGQNVNLDLERFRKRLVRAYRYVVAAEESRKFLNEQNR